MYYIRMSKKDHTGLKTGEVTILGESHIQAFAGGQSATWWLGRCSCGSKKAYDGRRLARGLIKNCGHVRSNSNLANPIFSPEDSDLTEIKWHLHNAGYAQRGGGNYKSFAHREVLERKIGRELLPGELTDHINRNKLDNRRENLRVADKSINSINRDKRPDNTTGYVGVYLYWPKEHRRRGWAKRWTFRVYRKGKPIFSGPFNFKTPLEAHLAREKYLRDV